MDRMRIVSNVYILLTLQTTFLVDERGGDDNSGYVTTGYFAGLTLGRVILIPVTGWIGKNNSIYV